MDNQPVLSKAEGPVQGQNINVPQTPASPTPIPPSPPIQTAPIQPQPPQTPPSGPEALRAGGPKSRKKMLLLLLLVILIAIVAGYLFLFSKKPGPELAAKVGDRQITVSQANEFANECSLEQKEAAEYLVDNIVLEKWAQDEKIAFSKEDQEAEEVRISGKPAAINCIAVQAKINLLREKLSQNTEKYREGKFIVVNFGRYNPSLPGWPTEVTSEAEREKLLKEERAYADNLVQSIDNDLKENKLTFEQAIEKVNNDTKVGINSWYATSAKSGPFTTVDYIEKLGLLRTDEVRQKADALSPGEISEPFVQKVPTGVDEDQGSLVDARWVIAKVERAGEGYQGTAEELLKKTREKYDTKIYLK
ncbi:MAG: hypothetical protein UT84_C0021G0005 [Candidatus Curtissbacteria bacterium GW2011_GWA1_40_16]|uniref:Uncharacterized protein n=1 Tax=Candidatus Curtissbacteria bacterium GW2011_GWA1_40_16 TaxID=1618405 RepID=A0A0G0RAF8_9BACT|nr:MAG: hypothetical protein UT84_C0021G0005 [Candidatus Curtissbacteria bacterium GW2011_GWA1_40_16]